MVRHISYAETVQARPELANVSDRLRACHLAACWRVPMKAETVRNARRRGYFILRTRTNAAHVAPDMYGRFLAIWAELFERVRHVAPVVDIQKIRGAFWGTQAGKAVKLDAKEVREETRRVPVVKNVVRVEERCVPKYAKKRTMYTMDKEGKKVRKYATRLVMKGYTTQRVCVNVARKIGEREETTYKYRNETGRVVTDGVVRKHIRKLFFRFNEDIGLHAIYAPQRKAIHVPAVTARDIEQSIALRLWELHLSGEIDQIENVAAFCTSLANKLFLSIFERETVAVLDTDGNPQYRKGELVTRRVRVFKSVLPSERQAPLHLIETQGNAVSLNELN